jgi:DNA-binding beta-propeller fold protein YncE
MRLSSWLAGGALAGLLALGPLASVIGAPSLATAIRLDQISATAFGGDGETGWEIMTLSPDGRLAFLSNALAPGGIAVVDISNPSDLRPVRLAPLSRAGEPVGIADVAAHPHQPYLLAAAPELDVVFVMDYDGNVLDEVAVGVNPDDVAIAPNGRYAVVADEGQDRGPGTVSLLDLTGGWSAIAVTTIPLDATGVPGVVDPGPDDLQPEGVAISADSAQIFVTLQENNAIVKIDAASKSVLAYFALGLSCHPDYTNAAGTALDPNWCGRKEPDGIAVVDTASHGRILVTADEGDTNASNGIFGGGRTISIFDADTGALIADTGAQITDVFGVAGRGNRRGAEPERVDLHTINGRLIAAASLERANTVAYFDLTDPAAPALIASGPTTTGPEGVTWDKRRNILFAPAEVGVASLTSQVLFLYGSFDVANADGSPAGWRVAPRAGLAAIAPGAGTNGDAALALTEGWVQVYQDVAAAPGDRFRLQGALKLGNGPGATLKVEVVALNRFGGPIRAYPAAALTRGGAG